jgi:SAM-dependent methyltransferase
LDHVWWRTHLRKLPELGFVAQFGAQLGAFHEVDEHLPFLTEALGLPQGARVLDLGCGRGSYAIRLAQWGFRVTAVEESEPILGLAREAAAKRGVELELRCAPPAEIPERSVFDGALMLDFGGHPDAENAAMLRAVAAALKPGGKLVFGMHNPYYWSREPRTEHRAGEGTDVIRRYSFDFQQGAVVSRVRFIWPTGERRDLPEARYRAYTLPELRSLAGAVGLADLRISGEDEGGVPRPDRPLDALRTRFFHCVALRPVTGESGEGI